MNKFPANWREEVDLPGAMVTEEEAERLREEGHDYPDHLMRDYVRRAFRGETVPSEYAAWA